MKKHLTIRVFGRVQGVFFRESTRQKAQELGLCGFVRNEPDQSVYLEAEGAAGALEALESWCRQGPPLARVDRVETLKGPVQGYECFEVRR